MNTKLCVRCKQTKEISLFKQRKGNPDSYCKQCASKMQTEQSRTRKGLVTKIHAHQRARSRKKGWELPAYTKEELYAWVISQPQFEDLYQDWVLSEFSTDKSPSIDRKDDYLPYTLSNIQLMTWEENNIKAKEDRLNCVNNKGSKTVYKYTLSDEFVEEYPSLSEAARLNNTSPQNIRNCIIGKSAHAVSFLWKYERT